MLFNILQKDITDMNVDAVVNPVNPDLAVETGINWRIFRGAGNEQLLDICSSKAPVAEGEVFITPGFDLPAKYIIHGVIPVYQETDEQQSLMGLYDVYMKALHLALKYKCESIAFPLLSTDKRMYPASKVFDLASRAAKEFLSEHEMDICLVVSEGSFMVMSDDLKYEVASYVKKHYVKPEKRLTSNVKLNYKEIMTEGLPKAPREFESVIKEKTIDKSINSWIKEHEESFVDTLLRLIDKKGLKDPEVYKTAYLSRQTFNKTKNKRVSKNEKDTVLQLAIALKLSIEETNHLLMLAGHSLSKDKRDLVVEYCILKGYDVVKTSEILEEQGMKPLVKEPRE